jgi:DNA-binding GntR family transcriptional regulator
MVGSAVHKTVKTNETLANMAYMRLRADLLACRLAPGQSIRINEVSVLLNTNPIAVREALSKLSSEGLVIAEPQKGFRATPISAEELRDLTRVRIEIENLCLRAAIEAGDINWESGIVAALHRLLRTSVRDPDDHDLNSETWTDNHRLFHEALTKGCDSPLLLDFRTVLFARSERYRRFSISLAPRERDLDTEHKHIADAVLLRDIPRATNLMAEHLQTTTDILLKNPHIFSGNVARRLHTVS